MVNLSIRKRLSIAGLVALAFTNGCNFMRYCLHHASEKSL
jgi:hypothetical protein